jgi:hypothetical protein
LDIFITVIPWIVFLAGVASVCFTIKAILETKYTVRYYDNVDARMETISEMNLTDSMKKSLIETLIEGSSKNFEVEFPDISTLADHICTKDRQLTDDGYDVARSTYLYLKEVVRVKQIL